MDSFYTKKGVGWSDDKINRIFKTKSQEEAGVKVMGTSKELEEAHIQLATMKSIMMSKTQSDQKRFMIQCQTREYEPRNSTMRKRHPTIFRGEVYEFEAISDLVLSMPYKFVNRLKEDVWTPLDKTWLKRLENHLKDCEKTSIKQIRLVRKTEAPNYTQNHETENPYDFENNIIYEIILVDDTKLNIKYGQICDFVSDEEWINGEINCLSDIGSKRIVTLSWGAKTKDSEDPSCQQLKIGDLVTVSNQGDKWIHHAKIISINYDFLTAVVRWESNSKTNTVNLTDCELYDPTVTTNQRKRKSTEFYTDTSVCEKDKNATSLKNRFYLRENQTKLCAEGSIGNLMNALNCSEEEMTDYWLLATSDLNSIMNALSESEVPKSIMNGAKEVDSIEKCLWILRKKFNFATTTKLKVGCFQNIKQSLAALAKMKFPVVISVESTRTMYNHVVVVWNEVVFDYEAKYTYPLTEDSLRNVCGNNTSFTKITSGYGIFPSKEVRNSLANAHIEDWGGTEYYSSNGMLKKYFLNKNTKKLELPFEYKLAKQVPHDADTASNKRYRKPD